MVTVVIRRASLTALRALLNRDAAAFPDDSSHLALRAKATGTTPCLSLVSTPEIFTGRSEDQKVSFLAAPFGAQGRTRPAGGSANPHVSSSVLLIFL
jgi:hypothetical protein